jgi:hypothetical protein
MNETVSALKAMAGTPVGLVILVVLGVIVAVAGVILAWRVLKDLLKASMWLLLLLLILALAAGAIWGWVSYKNPDPEKRARMRDEVVNTLKASELGKAVAPAESEGGAADASGGGHEK